MKNNRKIKAFLASAALLTFVTQQTTAAPVPSRHETIKRENFVHEFYCTANACRFAEQGEQVPSKERCASIKQTLKDHGCSILFMQENLATELFFKALESGDKDSQEDAWKERQRLAQALYECIKKAAHAEYGAQNSKQ